MAKSILVASGHGGPDSGAVSADGTLKEAALALELRDKVAAILTARGCVVYTDGARGINSPLRDSIALAKTCDIAVEIHFNAGPPTAKGVECLALPEHKALAQRLCLAVAQHTKTPRRGDGGWKAANSGQHHRLGFIADGHGLILEIEFISNKEFMATYLAKRNEIASSLADVLAETAGATAPLN